MTKSMWDDSLSLVLPVHNAQESLADDVERVLEEASDLRARFEVLIIDDASTDGTEEVAWDLRRRFANVEVVRHPFRHGLADSLRTAFVQTRGEFIALCPLSGRDSYAGLRQAWEQRRNERTGDENGIQAQSGVVEFEQAWLTRLFGWGRGVADAFSRVTQICAVRIYRRSELERLFDGLQSRNESYLARIRRQHQIPALPHYRASVREVASFRGAKDDNYRGMPAPKAYQTVLRHVRDFAQGE